MSVLEVSPPRPFRHDAQDLGLESVCHSSTARMLGKPFVWHPEQSFGSERERGALIQADNLAALAVLQDSHAGKVRCIYIDPPYNNQERYRYYTDVRAHEDWLRSLRSRLEGLWPLLSKTGSIWISIDDREVHYLKVMADEVFGRDKFLTTVVWQMRTTRENRKVFSNDHEYLLVYARDPRAFKRSRNMLPPTDALLARYKNCNNDPRGPWQSISANVQSGHGTAAQFYELVAPNGKRHRPPEGRCWVYSEKKMKTEITAGNIWFGKSGNNVPRVKKFLHSAKLGLTPNTFWDAAAVGTNDEAKKQLLKLLPGMPVFDTPKPEALVARVLQIATDPDDLVLDAYAGSGTTAAVAHKTGRRYLGIEIGSQAVDVCVPRLRKVVEGEGTGISQGVDWAGGGAFGFYRLSQEP